MTIEVTFYCDRCTNVFEECLLEEPVTLVLPDGWAYSDGDDLMCADCAGSRTPRGSWGSPTHKLSCEALATAGVRRQP
jgi:hypothetical protein